MYKKYIVEGHVEIFVGIFVEPRENVDSPVRASNGIFPAPQAWLLNQLEQDIPQARTTIARSSPCLEVTFFMWCFFKFSEFILIILAYSMF